MTRFFAPGAAAVLTVAVVLGEAAFAGLSSAATPVEIPHRQGTIVIDGDLGDWTGSALEVRFVEIELPTPVANSVVARLAWDQTTLWVAISVKDAEVFPPPPGIEQGQAFRLARWDSVEVYLDTDACGGPRMDHTDFQFILSCDGRAAIMQGDPMVSTLEDISVPKLERKGLGLVSAGSLWPWGYEVECAIPLQVIGVQASPGTTVGLDIGCNDWTESHPVLPEVQWGLEALQKIEEGLEFPELPLDGGEVSAEEVYAIFDRAYHPFAWSDSRDWGYPHEWRKVILAGRPAVYERLVNRFGLVQLIGAILVIAMVLVASTAFGLWLRFRRRVSRLLERFEQPASDLVAPIPRAEEVSPPEVADTERPPTAGLDVLSGRTEHIRVIVKEGGDAENLIDRAIFVIHENLADNLAPKELAEHLNVSLRTLQRYLATSLDCTPRELIMSLKMREAKRLLRAGKHNVTEAAMELGFSSSSHFSSRFKTFYKKSPIDVIRSEKKQAP
jgi:AraC-like DNA-binding protein